MNKVVRNVIASVAFLGLGAGAVACTSDQGYTDTQYVYVHGYYDHYHHYHVYSTPHRVTRSYYNSHKSSYPKPYKTTTVRKHTTSVNKAPKRLGGGSSYKKSGGSSYKAPRSSNRGFGGSRRR